MGKPNRRLEQTLIALCDELDTGLRSFYAARVIAELPARLFWSKLFRTHATLKQC